MGEDVASRRDQRPASSLLDDILKSLGFGQANWCPHQRAFWPIPSIARCFRVNFHHLTRKKNTDAGSLWHNQLLGPLFWKWSHSWSFYPTATHPKVWQQGILESVAELKESQQQSLAENYGQLAKCLPVCITATFSNKAF